MTTEKPSFLSRLAGSVGFLFRYIGDADFAAAVRRLGDINAGETAPAPTPAKVVDTRPESALQLMALLQQEARLIDFVQEDLDGFGDAEIGAVGRVLHAGCRKVIGEHFTLSPVSADSEQSRVTLDSGFDAACYRLTGNLAGEPPYTGDLVHPGWRVTDVRLPRLVEGHDLRILAPAEVEL